MSYDSLQYKVHPEEAEEMLFIKPTDNVYPKKGNYFSKQGFKEQSPFNKKKYN
jgi:hypothetical protein